MKKVTITVEISGENNEMFKDAIAEAVGIGLDIQDIDYEVESIAVEIED